MGRAATAENDYCFGHLPRLTGDHSIYPAILGMRDGDVEGLLVMGENPAVGSANAKLHRMAMANARWLVVRDMQMIESATFWKDGPEIQTGELRTEEIETEIFYLPAAAHTEKDGSFTNTQRLLQWHHKAVEPPEDCRSELWFMFHLVRRIREKLAASIEPRDRPLLELTWDYPTEGPTQDPDAEAVLREISGFEVARRGGAGLHGAQGRRLDGLRLLDLRGVLRARVNQTARRKPGSEQTWVAPEWGWAWPMNRRIIYNRASADPEGRPWSDRKKYVWWDQADGKWTGADVPDFRADKAPDYEPPAGAKAEDALRGDEPFIMQADGKGWLYAPTGLTDGPLPTHYEPHESPSRNVLYGAAARARPASVRRDPTTATTRPRPARRRGLPLRAHDLPAHRASHRGGHVALHRPTCPSSQPEIFVRGLARAGRERGLEHGAWATIVTARTAIEARVMVTDRMIPLTRRRSGIHQVGLPYHWGGNGPEHRRLRQRPPPPRPGLQRAHLGGQGAPRATSDPAGARAARRCWPSSTPTASAARGRVTADLDDPHVTGGAAGHTPRRVLHRHVACASDARHARSPARNGTASPTTASASPACRMTTPAVSARTPGGTSRSSSNDGPLDVQDGLEGSLVAARRRAELRPTTGETSLADVLRRVQALHERRLPGGLPDRVALPHGVRHGGGAAGHLQRLRLLRSRLSLRRDRPPRGRRPGLEVHALLRPVARTTRNPPAPRPAPPTPSSSASSTSCARRPTRAWSS